MEDAFAEQYVMQSSSISRCTIIYIICISTKRFRDYRRDDMRLSTVNTVVLLTLLTVKQRTEKEIEKKTSRRVICTQI